MSQLWDSENSTMYANNNFFTCHRLVLKYIMCDLTMKINFIKLPFQTSWRIIYHFTAFRIASYSSTFMVLYLTKNKKSVILILCLLLLGIFFPFVTSIFFLLPPTLSCDLILYRVFPIQIVKIQFSHYHNAFHAPFISQFLSKSP